MLKLSLKDIDDTISEKVSLFCDNNHLGESYAEYCTKVKSNWEHFVSIVTHVIDQSYEYLSNNDAVSALDMLNHLVLVNKQAFVDARHNIVSLSDSFLSINDFCLYISYLILLDEGYTLDFPNFEWDQSIVRNKALSIDEVLQDINAIWHAVTVDAATAETLSQTEGLSISERLSAFRDIISRTFSSAFDDISGYLGRCQDMITNGLTAMDVWKENLKDSGILGMSKGEIQYPSESINNQYCGVSPASAYYWDSVSNVVSSTVIGIGSAIISGVNWLARKGLKWISKLFKKTVKVVQEKAINPQDLEIINDQGNYTVDTTFGTNIFSILIPNDSVLYEDLITKNKSYHIETKFAEHIFQKVNHSSGITYDKVTYFDNIVKAMQLWYMFEKGLSQITTNISTLPDNIIDLSRGIINNGDDEYDINLSIIENFQNSRFRLYFSPVSLMDFIRINYINNNYTKLTIMCKTKFKPINLNIFFEIIKNQCWLTPIIGLYDFPHLAVRLKPGAYNIIYNSQDLYITDVSNETGMYNSIFASYILENIFWGDAIDDYAYYVSYNRGLSSESDLFNTSIVGYYLDDIVLSAQGSNNIEEFITDFNININLQYFLDTYSTNDDFLIGVTTNKLVNDISFRPSNSTITNLDYFNLCSLTNRIKIFNYQDVIDNIEISATTSIQLPTLYEMYIHRYSGNRGILSMIQLYFSAFNQESMDALNFKFIPYTTGRINFKNSMFRIRTDAENITEFNNWITGIVVGTIVIAATISSIFLIKSVIRKSLLIRNASKRRIENKLLNKEKLTNYDIKQYAKYNRKQNRLSKLVGNSVSASNILSNDNILDANDKIISLITG